MCWKRDSSCSVPGSWWKAGALEKDVSPVKSGTLEESEQGACISHVDYFPAIASLCLKL